MVGEKSPLHSLTQMTLMSASRTRGGLNRGGGRLCFLCQKNKDYKYSKGNQPQKLPPPTFIRLMQSPCSHCDHWQQSGHFEQCVNPGRDEPCSGTSDQDRKKKPPVLAARCTPVKICILRETYLYCINERHLLAPCWRADSRSSGKL